MKTFLDKLKELEMMANTEVGRIKSLQVETNAVLQYVNPTNSYNENFRVDLQIAIIDMQRAGDSIGSAVKAEEGK